MEKVLCKAKLKTAILPCLGLGDGLIALVLAHNLQRAGREVTVYHPILPKMASLFPGIKIEPRPQTIDHLHPDSKFIVFYEKLDWMKNVVEELISNRRDQSTILNPIATRNRDYPFWKEGCFDGSRSFVENLMTYLKEFEGMENPVKENGITLPSDVVRKRFPKRVVIHPTSSRKGKNWSKHKYLKLADHLSKHGFEPVFILTEKEASDFPEIQAPRFNDLIELTYFVAESGYMIGNDSGIGHLASSLKIPTLTICRNQNAADFWRPALGPGKVITPPSFIPNLKGMRWRDQKWQYFISVKKVLRTFLELRDLI